MESEEICSKEIDESNGAWEEDGKNEDYDEGDLEKQRDNILCKNHELQFKILTVLPSNSPSVGQSREGGDEKQYNAALLNLLTARQRLKTQMAVYSTAASELQDQLDAKEKSAQEIAAAFRQFKREIAEKAVDSQTGKAIPVEKLDLLEASEQEKNRLVEKERMRNIRLQVELKRLEKSLKAKEKLAGGLTLSDFEHLQAENKALSTKVKMLENDIRKFGASYTESTHVMAHVKEKLRYSKKVLKDEQETLQALDKKLPLQRCKLTVLTRERDTLREQNEHENQQSTRKGLISKDYQRSRNELEELKSRLAELKARYRESQV